MNDQELIYRIATTLLPGIGDVKGKKLLNYFGSAENLFDNSSNALRKIPGLNPKAVDAITNKHHLKQAENELEFIKKNKIKALFFMDDDYPFRLKNCDDAPVLIYFKGTCNLNKKKIISIVGTRKATTYGKDCCKKIIDELKNHEPLIVSGLAFGIDVCAHEFALQNNLETLACLAHGLDVIYPWSHKKIAAAMLNQGGLITEFISRTKPDRENFPKRNRIIAGIADAVLVIEAGEKGGALITADIANSYNRDVFAFPGKVCDEYSKGCNMLIKTHKAALITGGKDVEYLLGWEKSSSHKTIQTELFHELDSDQSIIHQIIAENQPVSIDKLSLIANFSISKTAAKLLEMEFSGLIKVLPGKYYELNK